jgi:hypothetical protein
MQHKYKFMEWIDIEKNGVLTECAVMKKLNNGDVYFFPIAALDDIDKRRLLSIITGKNASLYNELWQLLEQHTLGNGVNAMSYFNQLVKVLTASGQILPFGGGRIGSGTIVMQQDVQQPVTAGVVNTTEVQSDVNAAPAVPRVNKAAPK